MGLASTLEVVVAVVVVVVAVVLLLECLFTVCVVIVATDFF